MVVDVLVPPNRSLGRKWRLLLLLIAFYKAPDACISLVTAQCYSQRQQAISALLKIEIQQVLMIELGLIKHAEHP